MENLRVATVQFQHVAGERDQNLARIKFFVQQAAEQQVQLICFPECCITGYWHLRKLSREQLEELAEPVPDGPACQQLLAWAAEFEMSLSVGLIERDSQGRLFNSQVLAMPDGRLDCHRKLHCFIHESMESGDSYTVSQLPTGHRVGTLICYDNNLIENVRATALLGAEILLAPHQTGGCDSRSPQAMGRIDVRLWEQRETNPEAIQAEILGEKGRGWLMRWLPARAHDNGLFVVFSNGIGQDDDEVRTGNAMILDPYGRILSESRQAADDWVWADLDGSLRERSTGVRWMRARRPDLYRVLTEPRGEVSPREARFGN